VLLVEGFRSVKVKRLDVNSQAYSKRRRRKRLILYLLAAHSTVTVGV
jgi:hypothetical protein